LEKPAKRRFLEKPPANARKKKGSKIPIIIGFAEVHRYLEKPPAKVFPVWKRVSLGLREVAEVDRLSKQNAA